MPMLKLQTGGWENVHSLLGVLPEETLVIRNYGTKTVFLEESETSPTSKYGEYALRSAETIRVDGTANPLWARGEMGTNLYVNTSSPEKYVPYTHADVDLPIYLISGDAGSPKGARRIRVESGEHSFWEGNEFRTFKELNISNGQKYVIKAEVANNIILHGLQLEIDDGSLRVGTYLGGNESGSFVEDLPMIPSNTMTNTPQNSPSLILSAGGSHSGGTELDVIRLKTAVATAQSVTVGSSPFTERGVGPGTYYFRFENIGQGEIHGVFRARWEEINGH